MATNGNAVRKVTTTSMDGAVNDAHFGTKIGLAKNRTEIRNIQTNTKQNTASTAVRRTTADRSDLLERTITKNVRTSAMPGAPTSKNISGYQTTDESFTSEYARKGLQPTTLGTKSGNTNNNSTEEAEKIALEEENAEIDAIEEDELIATQQKTAISKLRQMKRIGDKTKLLRKGAKQLKATTVTYSIWSWSIPAYIFIQLPIALMTLIFFGIGLAVDAVFESGTTETSEGFWTGVWNTAKAIINSIAEAINAITKYLFNFDFGALHPGNLFFVAEALLLGLVFLQIIIIYFIYKFAFINPIFGKETGSKPTMFMLMWIGLAIPGFNLLPWVIFWTMTVWKNPK